HRQASRKTRVLADETAIPLGFRRPVLPRLSRGTAWRRAGRPTKPDRHRGPLGPRKLRGHPLWPRLAGGAVHGMVRPPARAAAAVGASAAPARTGDAEPSAARRLAKAGGGYGALCLATDRCGSMALTVLVFAGIGGDDGPAPESPGCRRRLGRL